MKGLHAALLSVIFVVFAVLMMKIGVMSMGELGFTFNQMTYFIFEVLTNPIILIGIILFFASSLFWLYALSKEDLSKIYPLMSLNFAIVAIISYLLFNESLSFLRILGIIIIGVGVVFISKT